MILTPASTVLFARQLETIFEQTYAGTKSSAQWHRDWRQWQAAAATARAITTLRKRPR